MNDHTHLSLRSGPITLLVDITGWTQDQWEVINGLIHEMEDAGKRLSANRTDKDPAHT